MASDEIGYVSGAFDVRLPHDQSKDKLSSIAIERGGHYMSTH